MKRQSQILLILLSVPLFFLIPIPGKAGESDKSAKVYSLAGLGQKTTVNKIGLWLCQIIPDVIEPESWTENNRITFHAPTQVLVVYQSEKVQKQVGVFLKKIRKNLPGQTEHRSLPPAVTCMSPVEPIVSNYNSATPSVPATNSPSIPPGQAIPYCQALPEAVSRNIPSPAEVAPEGNNRSQTDGSDRTSSGSYPVPKSVGKTPKHLFHFIIRYEGEGIVDDNVVKMMKDMNQSSGETPPVSLPPTPNPPLTPDTMINGANPPAPLTPDKVNDKVEPVRPRTIPPIIPQPKPATAPIPSSPVNNIPGKADAVAQVVPTINGDTSPTTVASIPEDPVPVKKVKKTKKSNSSSR